MISYTQARSIILEQLGRKVAEAPRAAEKVALVSAHGRVLAAEVVGDRDYPPFDRATRDGYAVRAADVREMEARGGAGLKVAGEIKAGDTPPAMCGTGECLRIMTGAPVPAGADAVAMVEFAKREGEMVKFTRGVHGGQNVVRRGSEARAGQAVLRAGTRMGYAEMALAAQVGAAELECVVRPRVAILSTGDEIVSYQQTPGPFQIRNSNTVSLAAQVRLAGGEPVLMGNAADREEELREKILAGLREDVLVLSGGVSMGIYDLVEKVLREMGAEFHFDAVAIRPGKPAVFAMCEGKPVFGLPGNPLSTMVTFELFVAPAVDLYGGAGARALPLVQAVLGEDLNEKPGMTHFLPACVEWPAGAGNADNDLAGKVEGGVVRALRWQGSGDIPAMAKANCFLVVGPEISHLAAGNGVPILLRRDAV
jgi:molybdopterin molybdotransferase